MKDAAPRQLEVLAFVHGYRQQHDFAPTRKEIAVGIGLASPAGISQHLEALERKGFVHCLPGKQRAISLTDAGLRTLSRHRLKDSNVCEHGDHAAPTGKRFCSRACEECELTDHDAAVHECAGICLSKGGGR
jgi:SOS-response transcriptional repressor LexA